MNHKFLNFPEIKISKTNCSFTIFNVFLKKFFSHFTGAKYEPSIVDNAYKVHMKLTIKVITPGDYGSYKCVSKNSLGETDGTIKLYRKYSCTCSNRLKNKSVDNVIPKYQCRSALLVRVWCFRNRGRAIKVENDRWLARPTAICRAFLVCKCAYKNLNDAVSVRW